MKCFVCLLMLGFVSCATVPISQNRLCKVIEYGEIIRSAIESYHFENQKYPDKINYLFGKYINGNQIRIMDDYSSTTKNVTSFYYKNILWDYQIVSYNNSFQEYEIIGYIIPFEDRITRNYENPYSNKIIYKQSKTYKEHERTVNGKIIVDDKIITYYDDWIYMISWNPTLRSIQEGYYIEPDWERIIRQFQNNK